MRLGKARREKIIAEVQNVIDGRPGGQIFIVRNFGSARIITGLRVAPEQFFLANVKDGFKKLTQIRDREELEKLKEARDWYLY